MSYIFKKGTTSQSIEVYIIDSTNGTPETGVLWNTAGIDLKYRRKDAVVVSITEAALTTPALTDTWESGGFLEIGNGVYRLDLPNAVLASASGIDRVVVFGTVTGMVVLPVTIHLIAMDLDDAVRAGLTALPNANADASGGLPISDDGGLDLDAMNVQLDDNFDGIADIKTVTDELSSRAAIADAIWDEVLSAATHNVGASAGKRLRQAGQDATLIRENTCQAGSDGTDVIIDTGASGTNNFYDHMDIILTGGTGAGQVATMHNYNGTTYTADVYPSWVTNPDGSTTYAIIAKGSTHVHEFENNALAQINAEVDTTLADINLDHLMKVVVADRDVMAEVVDGTVLANLMTKTDGDTSDFDPDTDSLEAIRDQSAQILTDTSAQDTATKLRTLLTGADTPVCKDSTPLSAAEVNSEVVDTLNVDTYAEPGQEAPATTASLVKKIGYLYKFLRNKVTNDGTNIKVYNDAGAVVDQKNTVGEAGGTVTRGKFGSGP